jgi:hypothetical protein
MGRVPGAGASEDKCDALVNGSQQSIEVASDPFRGVEVTVPYDDGGPENGCKIDVDEILLLENRRNALQVGLVARAVRGAGGKGEGGGGGG